MDQLGIERAVNAAGSQSLLALELGVSTAVVSMWVSRGWVPWRRALEIERRYGVPRGQTIKPAMRELVADLQPA